MVECCKLGILILRPQVSLNGGRNGTIECSRDQAKNSSELAFAAASRLCTLPQALRQIS